MCTAVPHTNVTVSPLSQCLSLIGTIRLHLRDSALKR